MSDIAAAGLLGTAINASNVAATPRRPSLRYAIAIMPESPCKRAKQSVRPTSMSDVGAFLARRVAIVPNIKLEKAT
ncbi:MAG TPA: hypothetical protein VMM15_05260 [Bradyrhizobium sp.]|nr:hypothetical protein [Bradyrhizobium sp.]